MNPIRIAIKGFLSLQIVSGKNTAPHKAKMLPGMILCSSMHKTAQNVEPTKNKNNNSVAAFRKSLDVSSFIFV